MELGNCYKVIRSWPSKLVSGALVTAAHRVSYLGHVVSKIGHEAGKEFSRVATNLVQWGNCVDQPHYGQTKICRRAAELPDLPTDRFIYRSVPSKVEDMVTNHLTGDSGVVTAVSGKKFFSLDPVSMTLAVTTGTDLLIDAAVVSWKLRKAYRINTNEWTDRDIVGEFFKWGAAAACATTLSAPLATTMAWYGGCRVAHTALSCLFSRPQEHYAVMNGIKSV